MEMGLVMKKLLLTLFFILFAFPVYALELLMAHNPKCPICERLLNKVEYDSIKFKKHKNLHLKIII